MHFWVNILNLETKRNFMLNALRKYKFPYMTYNFFHREKLAHNIPLYKKYGLKKKYYSSVSSSDFKNLPENTRVFNLDSVRNQAYYQQLNEESKRSVDEFDTNGYAIIKNFISPENVDTINSQIDELVENGTLKFKYINKLMFAIHHSELISNAGTNPNFLSFLSSLFDGKAKLFQSINFLHGSQQKTHSDSIHMTTYPLGGLIGVWIALEDIDEQNGALHYIPGSHKLPYFMNEDYDNSGNSFKIGEKGYKAYEEFIDSKVKKLGLKKEVFHAKKGDALIWHANILHGGEPHLDKNRTRKSLVYHYFDQESICYHEVTERPALFNL